MENIQKYRFRFEIIEEGQIFKPILGLAASKIYFFYSQKKLRVGHVYIDKSFDTIFNIGGGWDRGVPHAI